MKGRGQIQPAGLSLMIPALKPTKALERRTSALTMPFFRPIFHCVQGWRAQGLPASSAAEATAGYLSHTFLYKASGV